VAKLWQNGLSPALITLSFRNGMGYRYLDERSDSVNVVTATNRNSAYTIWMGSDELGWDE